MKVRYIFNSTDNDESLVDIKLPVNNEEEVIVDFQTGCTNSIIVEVRNKQTLHSKFYIYYPENRFCELFYESNLKIRIWKWNIQRREMFLMNERGEIVIVKRGFVWNNDYFSKFYESLIAEDKEKWIEIRNKFCLDDEDEEEEEFDYEEFCEKYTQERRWDMLLSILREPEDVLYNFNDESDAEEIVDEGNFFKNIKEDIS